MQVTGSRLVPIAPPPLAGQGWVRCDVDVDVDAQLFFLSGAFEQLVLCDGWMGGWVTFTWDWILLGILLRFYIRIFTYSYIHIFIYTHIHHLVLGD